VIPLKVSAPFHCPLLAPAAKRLEAALEQVELKANLLPVVPNVTASVVAPGASAQTIRALLVRQVVEAVRWEESLRAAIEFGATRSVCLGPGTALRSHMKRVSRRFALVSMDDSDQRKRLLEESIND
jgi:[acyl-carrier-protein] S-malonyltransferase